MTYRIALLGADPETGDTVVAAYLAIPGYWTPVYNREEHLELKDFNAAVEVRRHVLNMMYPNGKPTETDVVISSS